MSKDVIPCNRVRLARWPATWALVAALSLATFVLLVRSCAVVAQSDALSSFVLRARVALNLGAP